MVQMTNLLDYGRCCEEKFSKLGQEGFFRYLSIKCVFFQIILNLVSGRENGNQSVSFINPI